MVSVFDPYFGIRQGRRRDEGMSKRSGILEFAVLGLLRESPMHGYELRKRLNTSLGVAETQVIRQLNRRMDRATRREAEYDELIRELLAQDRLVHRASPPVLLPPGRFEWATEQSDHWIEWVKGSGIHVIGDLDDLRPVPLVDAEEYVNPDKVPARVVLGAAVDALSAMTREAAARPDPRRTFGARFRKFRGRS